MSDLNELTQTHQWPDSADTHIALVLAGGMALGTYQGGAYEKLHAAGILSVDWLAGSSVGAVNAALIAGSRPDDRIETLRRFWNGGDLWTAFMSATGWSGELRHVQNWLSVLQTRVFGAAGHFRPRLSLNPMKRSGASVEDYQFAGLDVSCMETCWRAADSCRNLLRCRSMVAC